MNKISKQLLLFFVIYSIFRMLRMGEQDRFRKQGDRPRLK